MTIVRRLAVTIGSRPRRVAVAVIAALLLLAGVLAARDDGNPPGQAAPSTSAEGLQADPPAQGTTGATSPGATSPGDTTVPAGPGAEVRPPNASTPTSGAGPNAATPSGADGGVDGPASDPTPLSIRPPIRCAAAGSPSGRALPGPDENNAKRWVSVGRLAGNCDGSSARFRLLGVDTRLVWRSNADTFVAFLVDAARGTDATAGFADAVCDGPCSEAQAIVPQAGEYLLEVRADDAPWEIEVQEYRAP